MNDMKKRRFKNWNRTGIAVAATIGLGLAAAVAHGYGNVFVTAPSPENLKTAFLFLVKGLDALAYAPHTDYEVIQSTKDAVKREQANGQ